MKQKIIPIVSVCVGILAALLTHQYLRAKRAELQAWRDQIYEGARKIKVIVAGRDLPSGSAIRTTDLAKADEFQRTVGDRAVTVADATMLLGKQVIFPIQKGQVIMWADIEGGRTGAQLATAIKPGMRAISLSVSGSAGVSGMAEPNDRVDVLGTFALPSRDMPGEVETVTLTVLQDVTILACGQKLAKSRAPRRQYSSSRAYNSVTLEVTPREAELLVFAQQMKGALTLSLRNPADVSFEKDLPSVNFQQMESSLPELNLYRQKNIRHKRDI